MNSSQRPEPARPTGCATCLASAIDAGLGDRRETATVELDLGIGTRIAASRSPRLNASKPGRTISTFSCDIARAVSRRLRSRRERLAPTAPRLRGPRLCSWKMPPLNDASVAKRSRRRRYVLRPRLRLGPRRVARFGTTTCSSHSMNSSARDGESSKTSKDAVPKPLTPRTAVDACSRVHRDRDRSTSTSGSHNSRAASKSSRVPRVEEGPHDLHVLLRHRPLLLCQGRHPRWLVEVVDLDHGRGISPNRGGGAQVRSTGRTSWRLRQRSASRWCCPRPAFSRGSAGRARGSVSG